MNTIPRFIALSLAVALLTVRVASVLGQDSQQFRDLKAHVEELQIEQMNREWDELEAQRKAAAAKQQAEQAQWQDMINANRQQINPLVQPDTGTDSLVKELRDLKDEIEQSRMDADFRQRQSARQERLAAMTPEERAAYLQAEQEAAGRPIDLSRLSPQEQESYFNTLRYALEHGHGAAVSPERQKQLQDYDEHQKWKLDEPVCHEEIQVRKWNHQTEAGKTFMIGVFKERHLGDRKADVDRTAKQIGARFYRLWEHHKWGNLEEVKVVFYK